MFGPDSPVTPRRGFLGRLALAGAALGLAGAAPVAAEAPAPSAAGADPEFEAWLRRLTGKHREVFDAPYAHGGLAAVWPRVYLMTMDATYPRERSSTMVIFRHDAIPLVMQDALWAKYSLGAMFDIKQGDAPATRNPFAVITGLLKSGVLIGACNAALTVYSAAAAKKMGLDPAAVKKEWVAGLFPGVQVVPSGVMAVGRAQELGCAYCYAG